MDTIIPPAPGPCEKCGSPKKLYGKKRRFWLCQRCLLMRQSAYQQKKYANAPGLQAREGREWRAKNSRGYLKSKLKQYGLTLEDYDRMLKAQRGVCAVCKQPETYKTHGHLSVDHDHDVRAIIVVRGLLCGRCNLGIGLLRHDPSIVRSAARYLTKHKRKLQTLDSVR